MANDPQPLGSTTARAAFARFNTAWGGIDQDSRMEQFRCAFAEEQLQAHVFIPGRGAAPHVIPADVWSQGPFPERVFLSDDVAELAHESWRPYAGRTVFVELRAFEEWLSRNKPSPVPNPGDFDPMDEPIWSLMMTLAWIARRNVEAVRWQMDPWRRANELMPASFALAGIGAARGGEPPVFFNTIATLRLLEREAKAGSIVATGLSSETGRPAQLTAEDWVYGSIHIVGTDGPGSEEWTVNGALSYSLLTFKRDDVLTVWPLPGRSAPAPVLSIVKTAPKAEKKPSAMTLAIDAAIGQKWPDGLPAFTSFRERDRAIAVAMGREKTPPSEDTFRRYFSRKEAGEA